MTKQQLKTEVEKFAKENNCTFIEAAKSLQGAAATLKNESIIGILHELKMEFLGL